MYNKDVLTNLTLYEDIFTYFKNFTKISGNKVKFEFFDIEDLDLEHYKNFIKCYAILKLQNFVTTNNVNDIPSINYEIYVNYKNAEQKEITQVKNSTDNTNYLDNVCFFHKEFIDKSIKSIYEYMDFELKLIDYDLDDKKTTRETLKDLISKFYTSDVSNSVFIIFFIYFNYFLKNEYTGIAKRLNKENETLVLNSRHTIFAFLFKMFEYYIRENKNFFIVDSVESPNFIGSVMLDEINAINTQKLSVFDLISCYSYMMFSNIKKFNLISKDSEILSAITDKKTLSNLELISYNKNANDLDNDNIKSFYTTQGSASILDTAEVNTIINFYKSYESIRYYQKGYISKNIFNMVKDYSLIFEVDHKEMFDPKYEQAKWNKLAKDFGVTQDEIRKNFVNFKDLFIKYLSKPNQEQAFFNLFYKVFNNLQEYDKKPNENAGSSEINKILNMYKTKNVREIFYTALDVARLDIEYGNKVSLIIPSKYEKDMEMLSKIKIKAYIKIYAYNILTSNKNYSFQITGDNEYILDFVVDFICFVLANNYNIFTKDVLYSNTYLEHIFLVLSDILKVKDNNYDIDLLSRFMSILNLFSTSYDILIRFLTSINISTSMYKNDLGVINKGYKSTTSKMTPETKVITADSIYKEYLEFMETVNGNRNDRIKFTSGRNNAGSGFLIFYKWKNGKQR